MVWLNVYKSIEEIFEGIYVYVLFFKLYLKKMVYCGL